MRCPFKTWDDRDDWGLFLGFRLAAVLVLGIFVCVAVGMTMAYRLDTERLRLCEEYGRACNNVVVFPEEAK